MKYCCSCIAWCCNTRSILTCVNSTRITVITIRIDLFCFFKKRNLHFLKRFFGKQNKSIPCTCTSMCQHTCQSRRIDRQWYTSRRHCTLDQRARVDQPDTLRSSPCTSRLCHIDLWTHDTHSTMI